jgi:hypothetical protein
MTVGQFHQHYRQNGVFGEDICIIALVDFLRVNIGVHYQSRSATAFSHSFVKFSPPGGSPHSIEIIVYTDRSHYECVLAGPPIALPTPPISEVYV